MIARSRRRAEPGPGTTGPPRRDRGQAAVLVAVITAVLGVMVMFALATFGSSTLARTRAQTVADAAALAGVVDGPGAIAPLVARHDAQLVSWRPGPGVGEITVVVSVDGVTATARASNAP